MAASRHSARHLNRVAAAAGERVDDHAARAPFGLVTCNALGGDCERVGKCEGVRIRYPKRRKHKMLKHMSGEKTLFACSFKTWENTVSRILDSKVGERMVTSHIQRHCDLQ